MSDFDFRVGTMKDKEAVHKFLLNNFRISEPITVSLDCQFNEVEKFFSDLAESGLDNEKYSTLVFEGEELVAVCLNSEKCCEKTEDKTIHFNPHEDYGKQISSGPYDEVKANKLLVFVNTMERDIAVLTGFPSRILKIDVLCVSKNCQGKGLGRKLVEKSLALAKDQGFDYVASVATACASQAIFKKFGLQTLQELPFSCFCDNGKPVFVNLHDQGKGGKLMGIRIQHDEDEDLK